MVAVVWAEPAEAALTEYVAYLHERDPRIAKIAVHDIRERVAKLGAHPKIGRRSRWPGFRKLSLSRWNRIAVYQVDGGTVRIVALYDTRQNLARLKPKGP
jgi:plasmid stabilization system protein ParE